MRKKNEICIFNNDSTHDAVPITSNSNITFLLKPVWKWNDWNRSSRLNQVEPFFQRHSRILRNFRLNRKLSIASNWNWPQSSILFAVREIFFTRISSLIDIAKKTHFFLLHFGNKHGGDRIIASCYCHRGINYYEM